MTLTVGRFTIRPTTDGRGDLILGVMFKTQDGIELRAGHVYELREVLGVTTIVDVGPSAIALLPKDSYLPSTSWMNSVDDILGCSGGRFVLTREEAQQHYTGARR